MAQFQFFEQFFQGGQQQTSQEKQNVPSDSSWYRQNWEGGMFLCCLSPSGLLHGQKGLDFGCINR